jgi:hypothetical protein
MNSSPNNYHDNQDDEVFEDAVEDLSRVHTGQKTSTLKKCIIQDVHEERLQLPYLRPPN